MKLIDLSALNKLVDELNDQAALALVAKTSKNPLEYISEVSKMNGLVAMIHHETSLLSTEIVKAYNAASAEALNMGKPVADQTGLKGMLDIHGPSIKDTKKN